MTQQKGADYWTKRISDQEMPALCSTVRDLEKLAKDDVSSLSCEWQTAPLTIKVLILFRP